MKKIMVTLTLIITVSTVFAQQFLIGKTEKQMKEYWELRIPDDQFDTGTFDNGEKYFGIPNAKHWFTFIATFDKTTGKCYTHSEQIQYNETSVMVARFKKAGLKFDEKQSKWIDQARKVKWGFEEEGLGYYLVCEKM